MTYESKLPIEYELLKDVVALDLELHEPLRSTLLLRFFEGLSAAEIARAQGIPAATVRSRLKDALDRIRAALDAECGPACSARCPRCGTTRQQPHAG